MFEMPLGPSRRSRGPRAASLLVSGLFLSLLILPHGARAAEEPAPLHERIDQLIAEANSGIAAPIVGDAEFLRRASLDLIGVPPSVDELRAFLADANPSKREAAVGRLLNHPRYARHMTDVFDVLLMERRPYQHVSEAEWRQYLLTAFRENRAYNQLAKEILGADGADPNPRAAVRFYLDRQADPNLLTRDVGRIFFGRDLQCAQCHDHPLIADYHQEDYHGLLAFFQSGAAFTAPAPDGKTYYVEKAGTNAVFESVFVSGKHSTGPKLLGLPEVEEPPLYPDEQYEVKPADGVRPKPKFSRRDKLAELTTNGTNRAFNENIANRLWAHMMGLGLVEPVDLHHSANPASNPALLRLLGEEFARSGFDVKAFLRELALTQTYQRSIDPPPDPASYASLGASLATELQQRFEQLKAATNQADQQYTSAEKERGAAEETAAPVVAELEQSTSTAAQAATKLDEAKAQLATAQAQVAAKTAVSQALAEAVAKTQEVAKALPQDQELLQAAQKFVERQQQVSAEMGTLSKDAEQKTAVVNESQAAISTAHQAIDAVRAKFVPLAEAWKQKKQQVVAARQQWADQETDLTNVEERLESIKKLAELKPLHERIAEANSRIATAETAVAEARKAAEAQQTTIAASEEARKAAEQQVQQATSVVEAAKQEYAQWEQVTATVSEAVAKTEAAKKLLPDDASLGEALTSLSKKLGELKGQEQPPKQKLADATAAQQTAQQQLAAVNEQVKAAAAEMAARLQKIAEAEQALATARVETHQQASQLSETLASLQAAWTKRFAMLPLKPLTPEQLCWSIFQVTGVYDRYVAAEQAELDKTAPLSEEDKKDPAKVAARELELQQRVYEKLKGNVGVFVSMYAPASGQPQDDFFASANQALFAANGGSITSWAAPAAANVTERVIQQADPKAAAEELYLGVLSRFPDEAEVAVV
jgi:predicted  nucleic acid-binding Zn-ribbon protein